MRDSMGRFMSGHERSNDQLSGDSKFGSMNREGGVETSTRGSRSIESRPQSSSPSASKASERRKAGRKSETSRRSTVSIPHRHSTEEAIGGPERAFSMADMTSTDDPFEDFEVESGSEKEFLIANLIYDAPQVEVEQFRDAGNQLSVNYSHVVQQWDTTMHHRDFEETVRTARVSDIYFGGQDWQEFKFLESATPAEIDARIYELILCKQDENGQTPLPSLEYPAPHLVLQQKVEKFARSHKFSVNRHIKPTTLQRREFTRDIYDYARAIGMGKHEANAEVLRARATYRHHRGLSGGLMLDESDDESNLGLEISDAAEYIASMINGMQRGSVDPAGAWDEIARLEAKSSNSDSRAGKRKRAFLDNHPVNGGVAAKRPSDAESSRQSKKRRRRKLKQRRSNGSNQELVELAKRPPIRNRRKEKWAMRRERAILSKPERSMDVKTEEKSPTEMISKHTPMTHSSSEHIGKASEAVSAGNKMAVELMRAEKSNQKRLTSNDNNHSVRNDAEGDSWDLRRKKKKKKRKRSTADGSGKNLGSHNTKTKIEPANGNTNINYVHAEKASLNMDHLQEYSGRTVEHENEVVKEDTADDSDEAIPLSELKSTNSNKKIQGRRDRGKGKKKITPTPKILPLVGNQAPASGDQFLDTDERKPESGVVEAVGDSSEIGAWKDDNSDIFTTVSQIPKTTCKVVINTPSKTWWPHVMAMLGDKAQSVDFDSSTSVLESTFSETTRDHAFTMSERSLDWDHSGPEFDEIKVEPKVTRSSPLKPTAITPTKALRTRSSSTTLQTPKSDRRLRDDSDQSTPTPAERVQQTHENISAIKKSTKAHNKSPFFSPPASAEKPKASPEKKPRVKGGLVSCIPFPPLSSPSFGLLQEKLSHDPFRLLVGVTFLNRTKGKHAIPVFYSLMERYPTPADILAADKEDIISMTRHLGLQAQRAETYKKFAHFWIHDPPVRGKRYRVDHYPEPGDGMDIKAGEVIDDEDSRVAWEIGHMTKGRYAIDSWRIFCRDILRGEADGWNGEGREDGFQPEWMRVHPRDKELIACLRWMWLKEGFSWDPVTGEKEVADRELMEAAIAGKIAWDDRGGMRIVDNDDNEDDDMKVKAENDDSD